jgi:hypothetical protein
VNTSTIFQPHGDIASHAIKEFVALWHSRLPGFNTRGIETIDDASVRLKLGTARHHLCRFIRREGRRHFKLLPRLTQLRFLP